MNFSERLLHTAFGVGMTLSAVIILLIASYLVPKLDPIFPARPHLQCKTLDIVDEDGNVGVTITTDEHGGSLTIHNKHDDVLFGMVLDNQPDCGRIMVHGKYDDSERTSIRGSGSIVVHSKDGATTITSTRLRLTDENNDITAELPFHKP